MNEFHLILVYYFIAKNNFWIIYFVVAIISNDRNIVEK